MSLSSIAEKAEQHSYKEKKILKRDFLLQVKKHVI